MRAIVPIIFALGAAFTTTATAQPSRPFFVAGPRMESVSMQLVKGQLLVRLQVEGRELTFGVDTGADHSLLDAKLAPVLKVALQTAKAGYGVDGKEVARSTGRVTLKAGRMTVTGYTMAFVDLSALKESMAQDGQADIDGILGADLLSVLRVRIDYDEKTMLLRLPQKLN